MIRATAGKGRSLPVMDFVAEAEKCPVCGGPVQIQKSKRRQVVTLAHGPIVAREIRKRCQYGECGSLKSNVLSQLVESNRRYGYDLVVQVGLWRYLAGQQREEIQRMLRVDYGIELSTGTVSALCDRFLGYLEALHVARAPVLREALEGGYPMHLDATCERGKGGLFVCIDGWRNWVLWAARVPSESSENLTPVVEETVRLFGQPVATVRDMGEGCAQSVAWLHQAGIPDLICHYHFLAAIGKKLFVHLYDGIRGMIRLTRCRADMYVLLRDLRKYSSSAEAEGRFGEGTVRDALKALVLWLIEGDGSHDAPFPFSLPNLEFVKRCLQVKQRASSWVGRPRSVPETRALEWLERIAARMPRDPRFAHMVEELSTRWDSFCELRNVLRLSSAELPRGDLRVKQNQLPALELLRLQQIKQAVDQYTTELERRIPAKERQSKKPASAEGIILKYLRRHGAKLFGHPVKIDEAGRIVSIVERTNNVAEHFFGQEKQQLRRRVGRGQLGRDLEKQPAQVTFVHNLKYPEYVRLLAGSIKGLPAAFANLNRTASTDVPPLTRDHRNRELQRLVRGLLEKEVHLLDSKDQPQVSPVLTIPSMSKIDDTAQKLESLSLEEMGGHATPKIATPPSARIKTRDPRIPPSGSVLQRQFGYHTYYVYVLEQGFVWGSNTYATPTEVVKAIKGTAQNGFSFFGLTRPWPERGATLKGRRLNRYTSIELPLTTES